MQKKKFDTKKITRYRKKIDAEKNNSIQKKNRCRKKIIRYKKITRYRKKFPVVILGSSMEKQV